MWCATCGVPREAEGVLRTGLFPLQHRLLQESGDAELLAGDELSLPGRVLAVGPGLDALLGLLRSVSRAIARSAYTCMLLMALTHRGLECSDAPEISQPTDSQITRDRCS